MVLRCQAAMPGGTRVAEFRADDEPLVRGLRWVIRMAVRALAVLMTGVIVFGVADVCYVLYQRLMSEPVGFLEITDIFATFGAFMAVLIAIEIFVNIVSYLRDDVIHVRDRPRHGAHGDRAEGDHPRLQHDRLRSTSTRPRRSWPPWRSRTGSSVRTPRAARPPGKARELGSCGASDARRARRDVARLSRSLRVTGSALVRHRRRSDRVRSAAAPPSCGPCGSAGRGSGRPARRR